MQTLMTLSAVAHPATLAALALIYTTAAVFSGLSGFGFSAIGCLSLALLPPQTGIAMLMTLSLVTQAWSLRSLKGELRRHGRSWTWRDGVSPYLVGGTAGMPVGLAILATFGARELSISLGALLIAYSVWSLAKPVGLHLKGESSGAWRSFLVGAAGGVVGGFSAFPGSALVVWNGVRGIGKEEGRALTQPFILWMQIVGLALLLITRPHLFSPAFWALFAAALPAALLGNSLGLAIYRRTGDVGYRSITFVALGVSGLGLVAKVLIA